MTTVFRYAHYFYICPRCLYMPTVFGYAQCFYICPLFLYILTILIYSHYFCLTSSPLLYYEFYLSYSMFGSSCSLFLYILTVFVWPPLLSSTTVCTKIRLVPGHTSKPEGSARWSCRSTWLQRRDYRSYALLPRRASQFDPTIDKERKLISNLKRNMSVLLDSPKCASLRADLEGDWLNSRFQHTHKKKSIEAHRIMEEKSVIIQDEYCYLDKY
jgi:hypothetical protein